MRNAFVTEVGYHLRDRLNLACDIRSAATDEIGNATSALTITLKAARQVGNMLKYYRTARHRTQGIVSTGDPKEIALARIVRRGGRVARS